MSGFSAKGLRHRKGDRETRGRGPKDFSSSRSLGKDGNGLRKNRRKVSTIKDLIFFDLVVIVLNYVYSINVQNFALRLA
jgi:hypothetical protein